MYRFNFTVRGIFLKLGRHDTDLLNTYYVTLPLKTTVFTNVMKNSTWYNLYMYTYIHTYTYIHRPGRRRRQPA